MTGERLIVKRPTVEMAPAATPTTFATIQVFVKQIAIRPKRGKIDTRGYADTGARNEKLDAEHEAVLTFYHSRDWSAFSALLVTELNSDDTTFFRVKYRGPTAPGVTNRVFQFGVKITDLGSIGGEVNTASMAEMTLPIEGAVQSSTDGTTFTDYF